MPQPRKDFKPATYRVLSGKHHIKNPGKGITTYVKGDEFESLTDPRKTFPNKFELVSGTTPDEYMKELIETKAKDSEKETV